MSSPNPSHSGGSHESPGQQTQSTDPEQQQEQVRAAQNMWREDVLQWFPNLHSQTYFVPPLYFSKVPYDVEIVAGQMVLVPHTASNEPSRASVVPLSSHPSQTFSSSPPLASLVWPDHPVPAGKLPVVHDSDTREDRSLKLVLDFLRRLADERGEVMLVVSKLEFRKYLDKHVDPLTAAAILLPPRPVIKDHRDRGEFDVLIISLKYGLILAEIKSVGSHPSKTPDLDCAVLKVTEKAIEQLEKGAEVLRRVVSDLAPITVTKTLVLPYITRTQLQQVLHSRPQLQQALADCLGASDAPDAVCRCLCKGDVDSPESSVWWQRTVTDHGPDSSMTNELYETLVARFCGPATTIEVPTVTTPRRSVVLKTPSEAVALTGLTMSLLTLHPQQVDLVSRPMMPRVFLLGPPGTGKTVVLVMKALQWLHQGKEIHLLSSHRHSRAVTFLIEHQLKYAMTTSATAAAVCPKITTHIYDFKKNTADAAVAVDKLSSSAREGELYIVADEAYCHWEETKRETREEVDRKTKEKAVCGFPDFCSQLVDRVPSVHLWASSVTSGITGSFMAKARLTMPVRSPPAVVKEVGKCYWINDRVIPKYTSSAAPSPTDGPDIWWIAEHTQPGDGQLVKDHEGETPAECKLCADHLITVVTKDLRVGQSGQGLLPLQYRDVFILCEKPNVDLPVVTKLHAQSIPVQVVTPKDDNDTVGQMALAKDDAVTVTTWKAVRGLERRIVVGMYPPTRREDDEDHNKLHAMSRTTSLLLWFT